MSKQVLFILFVVIQSITGFAQQNSAVTVTANSGKDGIKWAKKNPFEQKVFIENKGQFTLDEKSANTNILFSADIGHQIYFTKSGMVCRMSKMEPMTESEEKAFDKAVKNSSGHREKEEKENERAKVLPHNYDVTMEWVGANANVEVVTEEKVEEYWNYLNPADRTKSIERAAGFKKLIYKNLYPGIDVVYTFHPQEGLKYNLILHPGADASLVQMKYNGAKKISKDKSGNICYTTSAGAITDHAPETFYQEGNTAITSEFILNKNIVTFNVGEYDKTKTVVIDPWMNSSLSPACTVVELSSDAANNVYIYGFIGQLNGSNTVTQYVQKYNAAGALQWTFNFTSAMNFIQNTGDIVVDPAGNSYVTCGFYFIGYFFFDCMHAKLDPAGALQWNLVSPLLYENWRTAFNCDYTQLIQLGCGPGCCNVGTGDVVNPANGTESNKFSPPAVGDILASSYGKNGNLYFISVKDTSPNNASPHLTCLNPSTAFSVVFSIPFPVGATFIDGFNTNYGTYGVNGIVAGCSYLYVCLGSTLQKRDLNTGAVLASVTVPGGTQHSNSGTTVDKCGNVYVGSSNGVYVYSPNLSLLNTFSTPGPVLDITMGANGIFYACGGVATSSSNSGFVAQFTMSTICTPVTITSTPNSCGSSNIGTATAIPVFCSAPYSYSWSTSPVQTTQTATGLPSGTYTVIVTGAGSCNEKDTAVVIITSGSLLTSVATPTNISCNGGNNGAANATVSGGTSPFTYSWSPGGQTTQTASNLPAGVYSVTVTDASGCAGTQTVSITQPTPVTSTVNSTPTTCGGSNGSVSVNVAGGTSPYTYLWNPTGYTTATSTNVPSGNYSITVTDANGCATLKTVNVASSAALIVTPGNNGPLCAGANLNLTCNTGITWAWSGPNSYTANTQNPTIANAQVNLSGTYTVHITDANGCVGVGTTNVIINSVPTPTVSNNGPVCANQTLILNASGGTTYSWSGPNAYSSAQQNPNLNSVSANASGVYTVTVTNGTNCQAIATTSVTINPLPNVIATGANICINGIINLTASGGTSYSWSGPNNYTSGQQNPSIANATVNMSGAYVVTVTDNNGCANAAIAQATVNPSLVVVTSSNGPLCEGSTLNLTCNTGGTIVWSGPNGFSSNQQNPSITNAQAIAAGTYSVTVTNAGGCSGSATTNVVINPLPTSISPQMVSGCAPLCVNFANTSTVSGTCNWNFGDGTISSGCNPTHCFTRQGTFSALFTLTDNNGCIGTEVSTVIVYPVPHADFNSTPQPTTILEPEIHFANASSGATIVSYNWVFGDMNNSTQQNPTHTYQNAGNYPVELIITSDHGCKDTIIKVIVIDEDFEIFVPNAFTPNNDGNNDVFTPKGVGIAEYRLLIFDRWGNEIFTSNDLYKGWDGTLRGEDVQQDVYVWKINLTNNKGLKKELSGTVSLIK